MEADEYRRRARRYLVIARRVSDSHQRAKIIDLASKWMLFAERVERYMLIVRNPPMKAAQELLRQARAMFKL